MLFRSGKLILDHYIIKKGKAYESRMDWISFTPKNSNGKVFMENLHKVRTAEKTRIQEEHRVKELNNRTELTIAEIQDKLGYKIKVVI